METGSVVFILLSIIILCFIIYDSIPSKYTKLEESFWWIYEKESS